MPTLFLRLLSTARHGEDGYHLNVAWCIVEDDGSERAKGETDYRGLTDLIDPSADWLQDPGNVVVLVPTEHVLVMSCEVPGRSSGQIRRALPFVVEEFLASDIEAMHLASGPINRGEPTAVNLIDRVQLEDWLDCLSSLDLRPGYLIAEAELIPPHQDAASVLVDGESCTIRTERQAAAVDRDNLLMGLSALEISEIHVVHGQLSDLEAGQLDEGVTLHQAEDRADADDLDTFAYLRHRWLEAAEPVNLLQGSYTQKRPVSRGQGRWRAVATLAGVWLLVGLIGVIAQGFWASNQADALESRSADLYRDIFPGETRIINVRRQMSQKLGQRVDGQGKGFAEYLGYLAQGIDRNASILSLNYTETRDELAADLLLRNYDELERMKQRLGQLGVNVDITSAEQQDTGVRARIRLKG
jgi:general secretion pathway protein L